MIQIQVTMMSNKGYKPVSALVKIESVEYFQTHKAEVQKQGIVKICQKRYWNTNHIKEYGYTKAKMRVYDKEKIEQENKERYEKIKIERGWVKEGS